MHFMEVEHIHIGGRVGKIINIDEPADLDTMYKSVHCAQRERIIAEQHNALFVLIVFGKVPKCASEDCLVKPSSKDGWYPIQQRTAMHNANQWHSHAGVVIHCPYQNQEVVPTGVATKQLVSVAKQQCGLDEYVNNFSREEQLELNAKVEKFTPTLIQPSGYSLIIPDGELHVKMTTPLDFEGSGGVVHRRSW